MTDTLPEDHPQKRPRRVRCLVCKQLADRTQAHTCSTRSIPCGDDAILTGGSFPFVAMDWAASAAPDTSAYPWPLKLANWLDDAPTKLRLWLALRLSRLAGWVAP